MTRGKLFPGGSANVTIAGPGPVAGMPQRAWHLSDWASSEANAEGVALAAGWTDFQEPTVQHQWFFPAQEHGAVWLGSIADPRRFQIPIIMHRTSEVGFERVRESFFADLTHETDPATLLISSPSGTVWLDIRMDGMPVLAEERWSDSITQEQHYLLPVVSEQSHWQALEVARQWVHTRGWDPSSEIWNWGDLSEWPLWVLRGPGVFSLPDLDASVIVTVQEGETMTITGDPNLPLAVSDRREAAHRLLGGQRPRRRIAPHERWDLGDIRVVGGTPGVTSAVVRIDPRRRRPW